MGYFIVIFVVAILILGLLFLTKIPRANVLAAVVSSIILSSATLFLGMYSETMDTEIWSGKVLDKTQERVSCSHSYECNCTETCTTTNGHRSCSKSCSTCYEHSNDFDWVVKSTIGDFNINRVDRQGTMTPPRWSVVNVNDSVSKTNTYTNYIKGAKANVLHRGDTKITYAIPEYPTNIYDYYYIDRAISIDNAMPNLKLWSNEISKALNDLGGAKQVNIVMVFTKNPQDFSEQLNAAWLGGKKNDVIVVIGTQDGVKPEWVNVLSWTKQEDFKVALRDEILESKLDAKSTVQIIAKNIDSKFIRRKMKEFEYLQADIEPSELAILFSISAFLIPLGILWYTHKRARAKYPSWIGNRRTPSHWSRGR